MGLVDDVVVQKRLDELKESGIVLSPEQMESLKYEIIGRVLTQNTNVLHAESGAIVAADFYEALLVTSVARFTTRDFFIINTQVQPLYNIRNKYIGFSYYGKIRNIKKEKRRFKTIRAALLAVAMVSISITGIRSSFFITIMVLIAVLSFGYSSFMLANGEY